MKKTTIPTIIGIVVLVLGVAAGVFLLGQQQLFRLGASPDSIPKDVRISNISDSGFTVTWTTDKETLGFLNYGTDSTLDKVAHPSSTTPSSTHLVTIRNLEAGETYFFKLNSDSQKYDNNGIPWQTTTGGTLNPPTNSIIISGKVLNQSELPASNAIVNISSGNMSPLTTLTSESGEWVINLSNARNSLLTNYANITDKTLLEILVNNGSSGIATAQIYVSSANPTPPITLGRVYDFRSSEATNDNTLPNSLLELPPDSESSSGFQTDTSSSQANTDTVTLKSVKNGETIYTDSPEFFGDAPANTTISITVESDPQTETIISDTKGDWNWSPPNNLEEGEHTVTLAWVDEQGITQKIVKTFTVLAAETGEPAFESTPSTISTKTTSPSASPTATPRTSTPATDSAIPTPGTREVTIFLLTLAVLLLTGGSYLSLKSTKK